jgi:hypothetical protein
LNLAPLVKSLLQVQMLVNQTLNPLQLKPKVELKDKLELEM